MRRLQHMLKSNPLCCRKKGMSFTRYEFLARAAATISIVAIPLYLVARAAVSL